MLAGHAEASVKNHQRRVNDTSPKCSGGIMIDGQARRRRAQGMHADKLQDLLADLDPQLAEWADSFIFGEVWAREGLSHDDRMLVAITALATQGQSDLLANYLHGALQGGIDPRRIHEALTMLVVYAGFPPAIQALYVWRKVFRSAVSKGSISPDATPVESWASKKDTSGS
jgi:4-carboxymuconolactone decarboxylase